mmetsp:Transcript_8062/g.26787  ORF Transcript_8062/g.26787 Transcript_8062/m.26787 type:complete len:207 (+) Transcript_8062:53-673(+)
MPADPDEKALQDAIRLNAELKRLEREAAAGGESAFSLGADFSVVEGLYKAPRVNGPPGSRSGGPKQKRTFTSAPETHQARRREKAHYTWDNTRLTEIDRANRVLADKVARIHTRPASKQQRELETAMVPAHLKVASVAPSEINRRKNNDKIASENMALFHRLQAVKPTFSGGAAPKRRPLQSSPTTPASRKPAAAPRAIYRPAWQD